MDNNGKYYRTWVLLVWVMLHCLLTLVRTFFEVTRQRHLIMLSHESYIYIYEGCSKFFHAEKDIFAE